jgi:hypothetical protein
MSPTTEIRDGKLISLVARLPRGIRGLIDLNLPSWGPAPLSDGAVGLARLLAQDGCDGLDQVGGGCKPRQLIVDEPGRCRSDEKVALPIRMYHVQAVLSIEGRERICGEGDERPAEGSASACTALKATL